MIQKRGPGRPPKYPLRQMEVGETRLIEGTDRRKINRVLTGYRPMRFKLRTIVGKGVRVWRLA